jgi:hypothetical protein
MEIRGRTVSPESVPAYIRRLNGEKALNGRSFAALDMSSPAGDPAAKAAADPAKPAPRFIEFSLMSTGHAAERKP